MMARQKYMGITTMVLGALVLCAFAATAGEVTRSDGQTTVINSEPVLPAIELELEELWRRGGEDDEVMIGLPV